MKKYAVATIAASGLATMAIGIAAPALAAPTGADHSNRTTVGGTTYSAYPKSGRTPYGTYQNDNKKPPVVSDGPDVPRQSPAG